METYNQFVAAFHNEVQRSKTINGLPDLHCRHIWGFDAARLLREENAPHTRTFFRYCSATNQCPAKLFITLIKNFVNLHELHIYIQNELKTGK